MTAFATDFIGGLIGVIGGTPDFSRSGVEIGDGKIVYGSTINALINFLIVTAVIYFVIVARCRRSPGVAAPTPPPPRRRTRPCC